MRVSSQSLTGHANIMHGAGEQGGRLCCLCRHLFVTADIGGDLHVLLVLFAMRSAAILQELEGRR